MFHRAISTANGHFELIYYFLVSSLCLLFLIIKVKEVCLRRIRNPGVGRGPQLSPVVLGPCIAPGVTVACLRYLLPGM